MVRKITFTTQSYMDCHVSIKLRVKETNSMGPPFKSIEIFLLTLNSTFLCCPCHLQPYLYHTVLLFIIYHICIMLPLLLYLLFTIFASCLPLLLMFLSQDIYTYVTQDPLLMVVYLFMFIVHVPIFCSLLVWVLPPECTHVHSDYVNSKESTCCRQMIHIFLPKRRPDSRHKTPSVNPSLIDSRLYSIY